MNKIHKIFTMLLLYSSALVVSQFEEGDSMVGMCLSLDKKSCIDSFKEVNLLSKTSNMTLTFRRGCSNKQCQNCDRSSLNLLGTEFQNETLFLNIMDNFTKSERKRCDKCKCSISQNVEIKFNSGDYSLSQAELIEKPALDSVPERLRYNEGDWPLNPWARNRNIVKRDNLQLANSLVNVTFNNPVLTIHAQDPDHTYVIVNIRSASILVPIQDVLTDYEIDQSLLITDTLITVTVFVKDLFNNRVEFPVDKSDTCTITDCVFICKEYFTHFVCYSSSTQIFIAVSFAVSCLVLIISILYLLSFFHKSKFLDWILGKMRSCVSFMKKEDESENSISLDDTGLDNLEISNIDDYVVEGDEVKPPLKQGVKLPTAGSKKIAKMYMIILILSMFGFCSSECIGRTVIDSTVTECLHSSETSICKLNLNVQVVLPYLGSSVCITLIDKANNIPLGNIRLTLSDVEIRAFLTHQYFTSHYEVPVSAAKYCPTTTTWCEFSKCKSVSTHETSMLVGEAIEYPGVTECRSSCGCAGCNCFFCEDACLYTRYAFKPVDGAYRVSSISHYKVVPKLTYNAVWGNSTSDEVELILDTPYNSLGVIDITIVGELGTDFIGFGELGVVNNADSAYLAPFAKLGNPVFGLVGDIQSNYHEYLEQSPYYFDYPRTGVDFTTLSDTVSYHFPLTGLTRMKGQSVQLPTQLDNILWSFTPEALIGLDLEPTPIMLYLNSASDVGFEVEISKVCPILELVEVTGCYNCPLGGTFSITAKSSCDTGSAIIRVISENRVTITLESVVLTNEFNTFLIPFSSLDKNIQGVLDLSYLTIHSNKTFAGILNNPPPIIGSDPITPNVTEINVPLSEQSFTDWWDSLVGPLGILKYFIAVLLGMVALTILLGTVYCLIVVVKSFTNPYKTV